MEAVEHFLLMELVSVVRQSFDKFLHRAIRLEGEQGHAKRDIAPLSRFLCQAEALTELLYDVLSLPLLSYEHVRMGGIDRTWNLAFSMNLKMYVIVLWNVSSSTACSPTDR